MKILSLAQIDMSQTDARVVHLLDLAKAFRQNGVKTDVIVISSKPSVVAEEGLSVYVLPEWLTFWFIEGIICNILAWLIILLKGRRYDRVYIRHHSNLALATRFFPWQVPVWLEVNGLFSYEQPFRRKEPGGQLKLWFGTFAERLAFGKANRIFCVSPQMAGKIIKHYGVKSTKITVVSNGVDIEKYYPMDKKMCRRKLGLDENALYIGFIGHFVGWAGIDTLLNALPPLLKKHGKVRTLIVGQGEYFGEYTQLVNNLGIRDRIVFPGWVHKDMAPVWINAFDIGIVLTEPKAQGFSSIKLFSYMACGVPVLATDIPEFEIVRKYKCGILVSYRDLSGLQTALEQLIENETLRNELGKNGRKCAERLFSWNVIANQIISA